MDYNRIHIVDDDIISSTLLKRGILSVQKDVEIVLSETIDEAVSKIGDHNDLVFLDQNVKGRSGEEFINEVLTKGDLGINIVLISSHFKEQHDNLIQKFPFVIGKILKPVTKEDLLKVLC